jgi:NhaP-type Na+/H+ or K+/H+ antiporter
MSGTDPAAVLILFKDNKQRAVELLEIESLLNTPLIVILPFLVIDLITKVGLEGITYSHFFTQILSSLPDFFLRFVAGIGAGVFVGLILFRVMKRPYSETISPLALITAALLTYVLAENLGGNGVLAITALGLLFGTFYVKEKVRLFELSSLFANALEILVFFLIGLIINMPFTPIFLIKSLFLFIIYIIIRLVAINITFYNSEYTFKEKIFMTLNVQKGIAVAVVAFTLITLDITGVNILLHLILAFMIYSIILATAVGKFSKFFLRGKKIDKNRTSRSIRTRESARTSTL